MLGVLGGLGVLGVLGVLDLLPSCGATKSSGATFNMLPHSRPVLAFSRDLVRARARARVSVRVRVRG